MSYFSSLSKSAKSSIAAISSIGVILGAYFAVERWIDAKAQSVSDKVQQQQVLHEAKSSLIHDRLYQINHLQWSESQLKIAEMELSQIEDEIEYKQSRNQQPSASELRAVERLIKSINYFDEQVKKARENLANIDTLEKKAAQ